VESLFSTLPSARQNPAEPHPARNASDAVWEARLLELLAFRAKHGHVNVPRGGADDTKLATWVQNQRRFVRLGTLREDRVQRLEQCGIVWAGAEERRREQHETWNRMLGALRAFKRTHGHVIVPRGWSVEPTLAGWLANQRFLRKKNELLPERERRLAEVDAAWYRHAPAPRPASKTAPTRSRAQAWDQAFAALEDYAGRHGNCGVPSRWSENPTLARWVVKQRLLRKRGLLSPQRVDRLSRLGFEWSGESRRAGARGRLWEESLAALVEFRRTHGHSDVPADWREDRALALWAQRQRNEHRKGRLDPERARRLDALKFPWNARSTRTQERIDAWERQFAELGAFAGKRGHVDVPAGGALARWVNDQRRAKQVGALSAERVRRLESIGMCWSLREKKWNLQFAKLHEYRRRHGHCNVPTAPGTALSRWVSAQRTALKAGRLDPERRSRLDAIGFVWSLVTPLAVSR
jgi:hypothetical protein